jgi:predicted CoA-substrate-specific enzyme activase
MKARSRIGIDIGALFLKAVRIDSSSSPVRWFYRSHQGGPGKVLEEALTELEATSEDAIGITGSAAGLFADTLGIPLLDITRCQIKAVRSVLEGAAYIIDIGGGSVTLVQLDSEGRFQGYATNSLCAAGTGSFLDEQAGRLGVSYDDMRGFESVKEPPTIATRCAVFAKSDLIHRQQEGYGKDAMWSGLCRGMTRTLLGTLLNGKPLDGPTAVIGGVAQNREVIRWLKAAYPEYIRVPEKPHLAAAVGAALLSRRPDHEVPRPIPVQQAHIEDTGHHEWPLTMETSVYPSFEAVESYIDDDENEVRVLIPLEGDSVSGHLGVDIGSTSTKLALVDDRDRVVLDIYRKTAGDPIGATQLLFRSMLTLAERKGITFEILGVGTTGSGRKMVGKVIGADCIINEISAHVAGAVRTDPTIDTIFEIGGQDSKYMHVVDGHIRDSNMNYVCAAGTGSFVEEQAKKLGYPVDRVGPAILGTRPPRTSDRCTVFMEQDVAKLVQSGVTPEEALSGVLVSVVKNYLNKVVGNRHRSREKIFFQGATARNPALVAAFERLLGVTMVVSPYCHVMGAYGVAMLTRQVMAEQGRAETSFWGLDLDKRRICVRKETCDLCQNHCTISFADIEGVRESPSWGYMCGRDPEEKKVRVNPHEKALRTRMRLWRETGAGMKPPDDAPVVGIPQALTTYTYLPLWQRFFNRLGYKVVLSGLTNDDIRTLGNRLCGAEFCFPAKMAMGHVAKLAQKEGVDFILVPYMVAETPGAHTTSSKFCPYAQSLPSYARTALQVNGIDTSRILSPVVDLRSRESRIIKLLAEAFSGPLNRSRRQIQRAWKEALQTQRTFESRCRAEGRKFFDQAAEKGIKLLVLAGRPYNNFDTGLNLGLPQKIAEQGRMVVPLDFVDADVSRLGERYCNLYWNYGQKILATVQEVAHRDDLDVVLLTNFNCGPDSFLLTYTEEILQNRPFLALELDEHGADAGYMTRVEAFCDVLRQPRSTPKPRTPFKPEPKDFKDYTVWFPPMHPLGTPFSAAAFRRHGYRSEPLPPEDQESFELGRAHTRGSECLPTALTLGAFLKVLREHPGEKHALFMPTAEGPCRFGQYCTLHRQVLDRLGYRDVPILSPSSFNCYQGVEEACRRSIWKGLLAADVVFKAACKVRPYEVRPGETNEVLEEEKRRLVDVMVLGGDLAREARKSIDRLAAIETAGPKKPLVGVVGEIYVRCNEFANEHVIDAIERFGGEAWLAPMGEWILYTAATQSIAFYSHSRNFAKKWLSDLNNLYIFHQDHRFYQAAGEFLKDRHEPDIREVLEEGTKFMPINFEGEAIITVGRTVKFAHQNAAMVVNCAPFGCMPGTLTTAVFRKLSTELGIPVVSMFYDGHGNQNQRLEVFLNNAVKRVPQPAPRPTRRPETPLRPRATT